MTENEAIKGLVFLKEKLYNGIFQDRIGCIDDAIKAMKEAQEYRKIGTVEECREAMEKNKPKKIIEKVRKNDLKIGHLTFKAGTKTFWCPKCNSPIGLSCRFCPNCGKRLEKE